MDATEIVLLYQIINDDVKAYEKIFGHYYSDLCRFVLVYVKDKTIAEEIVQEVFITIWEKRKKLNIQHSLKSYLYSSVKNRALNYLRDNKPHHFADLQIARDNEDVSEINYLEYNELSKLIEESINSLPEKCKEIFLLSREENLSNPEIAARLDLSVKTVKNQMGIALQKIRTHLQPYFEKVLYVLLLNFI